MTDERREPSTPACVPISTYRLQVHSGFPLSAARGIVPYLARLGVGVVYTSPYFTAAPGSTHGYDVFNHNEINPEVGGMEAHAEFVNAVKAHALGHVVDFVPNHMGIGAANAWWSDVLENGASAAAARFFDIEWAPIKPELEAKLLLPVLGDQYGRVLERGELQLAFQDGRLTLHYFDNEYPTDPRAAARVYRLALERLRSSRGDADPAVMELGSIVASLQNLPPHTEAGPERVAERQREKEVARGRLGRLAAGEPDVASAIDAAVREFNGEPGRTDSFDALHELLEAQPYRLSHWRTASHEINYRRFFDVNTLAGLRVENAAVFEATHQLLRELLHDRKVDGVRIDHPDGLYDPQQYFDMLQDLAADALNVPRGSRAHGRPDRPLFTVAEKILSDGERLPARWAVEGTTGYNFLNDVNGLFVKTSESRRMRRAYGKLTGRTEPFDDVLYASKRLIMDTAMASERSVLAHMLERIAESNRRSRDFTMESLRDVITEVVACFPVYRTYVDERGWSSEDRAVVERAIARARWRNPAMEASLFDFFREVMLPRDPEAGDVRPIERRDGYPPGDAGEARERLHFAMKFQQYTGPVQAKGLEDTAFYRYNLLLSLNEVGGSPARFGRSVEEFHGANERRLREWPHELLATATHDTKLGEDVRARLNVLSEIPDEWSREASRWMRLNRGHRTIVDAEPAPDRNDEYRFYQALVGVWPADADAVPPDLVERLQGYMIKAVKEAKLHTSWITPNQHYENAVLQFVERTLTGPGAGRFLAAFLPFWRRIAELGMLNSLAQVTLKLGSPGVPDFYQGTELWDTNLVDPDNRRPVDYARRAAALDEIERRLGDCVEHRTRFAASLIERWQDGRIKLLLTTAGLRLRRDWPDLFHAGEYVPLETQVTVPAGVVAFARVLADRAALFVAPYLCASLVGASRSLPLGGETWKTSRVMLPAGIGARTFRHELTGAEFAPVQTDNHAWLFAGQLFETVPVAVLRTV
jgi:(1->4)-alpha-D-glucan 1-alpha-D-glucosylmutase